VICLIGLNISGNAQEVAPVTLIDKLSVIKAIDVANSEVYHTGFTEKNELFVILRKNNTKQWTLLKGDLRHPFSPCSNKKYTAGILSREGNRFALGCEDFSVEVWDTATGNLFNRFMAKKDERSKDYLIPFISPDGTKIVVDTGERAELWDITSNKKIADLTSEQSNCNCNRSIYSVEFSPDGNLIAIEYGGMVFLWNADSGRLLNRLIDKAPDFTGYDETDQITGVGTVRNMLFSKNSKMLITGSGIGITFLWDLETGEQLVSLNNRKEVRSLSFNPDGTKLLSMTGAHAFVWDKTAGKQLEEMATSEPLTTKVSLNWRYVIRQDKKTKTLNLYQYSGR